MEKPYLQDLFTHMSNEHGLTLLQSEMQEIIDICLDQSDYNYLRDVLKEIVNYTDKMENAKNDIEYNIASIARKDAINKAKQLQTEK